VIVTGTLIDALGCAQHTEAVADARIGFDVRRSFTSLRPDELAPEQPARIWIDRDHDEQPIGEIRWLERDGRGNVVALGEVDDGVEVADRSFSVRVVRAHGDAAWEIHSVSLVSDAAMCGVGMVRPLGETWPDSAGMARLAARHPYVAGLLERACARRPGDPIIIDGRRPEAELDPVTGVWWTRDRHGDPQPIFAARR
jgi:hypothetical protein